MAERVLTIDFEDFAKVDIRTGTVNAVKLNPKARQPAYVLSIDFGELGVRTSSAQLTDNYQESDLLGRQVIAVVNFAPKRIAGVRSEVLVLGAVCEDKGVVLLEPTFRVRDGMPIA